MRRLAPIILTLALLVLAAPAHAAFPGKNGKIAFMRSQLNMSPPTIFTMEPDGSLDARPMGCLQRVFDGTLWFITFRHSEKQREIAHDDQVLISYARP